jgi:inactivated superfamily I helicase
MLGTKRLSLETRSLRQQNIGAIKPMNTCLLMPDYFCHKHPTDFIDALQHWLQHVGATEKNDTMVQNTAHHIYTLLEQLKRTLQNTAQDPLIWIKLIKQQLRNGSIDFVGEPLEGLQVMGILESRTLDFPYVILAGINEGVLPCRPLL